MSHTIAVSLVASRSVDDERQQNKCSRKKLSEHPCVRVTAVDFLMTIRHEFASFTQNKSCTLQILIL